MLEERKGWSRPPGGGIGNERPEWNVVTSDSLSYYDSMPSSLESASSPSRRTVARGAVWTVPVVAVAPAAPTYAASGSACTTGQAVRYTAPAPSTASATAVTTSYVVPTGVSFLCFRIDGGGGGGSAARAGGSGARTTGRIAVTPGETLTLTVAAGGVRTSGSLGGAGGGGYGNGGSTVATSTTGFSGGSGGGGSAILRGATPLVVAGGGGGIGGDRERNSGGYTWAFSGGPGGAAGSGGAASSSALSPGSITLSVPGGSGAIGASPGGATTNPTYTPGSGTPSVQSADVKPGAAGVGRNGADGVLAQGQPEDTFQSGAGGGGYAGGGSGACLGIRTNVPAATGNVSTAVGGAGGGGSSYIGGVTVVFTQGLAGNGATTAGTRPPGAIVLY